VAAYPGTATVKDVVLAESGVAWASELANPMTLWDAWFKNPEPLTTSVSPACTVESL
jgi:hypothetical protein